MKKTVIFGTGSFAEVVDYYFKQSGEYDVVAFVETSPQKDMFLGRPVISFTSLKEKYPPESYTMFVAIGYRKMNGIRKDFYLQCKALGYQFATYVHSSVTRWDNVSIGENTFIFEDNTVQPFSKVGNNVVLWSGNHIGHHATIGDHCFITSHVVVSGHVAVGEACFIGVNTSIRDNIEIAERNLIGAGAIIMKSTKPNQLFVPPRTNPSEKTVDQVDF